jgi:cytochrome P450
VSASPNRVPGPKGSPIVGSTLEFQRAPLDFCLRQKARFGDLVRFSVAFQDWYLLSDPSEIHRVLVTDAARFLKPKLAKRLWRPFIGEGLLASDGLRWKRQHKLVLPGFHRARIESYASTMVDLARRATEAWRPAERRDFANDMSDLTLAIVSKTLFDVDVDGDARRVGLAIEAIQDALVAHINNPVPIPVWWPSETNKRKVRALGDVREVVKKFIDDRRASGRDHGDLLSMLVFAEDEGGARMSDAELHDEAMTLFFAGHETTSMALTWTWYLLACHPQIEERLYVEIHGAVGDRPITVGDLGRLPYLEMVVKESMRMFPSVWSYMREPISDYRIGDAVLPGGSLVFICVYAVHHDARHFSNPEAFRPERFEKENERQIPRGAYVPFAAGPRVCLGKSFAMMEARLVLATLLQRVRPRILRGWQMELLPQISLRPKGGLPVEVELRAGDLTKAHAGVSAA